MRIPLSLIKSFIHTDLQAAQIAETLTLLGLEVDGIINEHPSFAGVVVGEVLSAVPHPNAGALRLAQVSDGKETLLVVCGAPNCRAGMKTAFAKQGALLTPKGGKQIKIEKSTLRGVESSGMLCSEEELGLSSSSEGIIDLPQELKPGQDLVPILWDPVFEISLTPNLGHCMSALGVARELSAALQTALHRPKTVLQENGKGQIHSMTKAAVSDPALCPRYACRLIEGVKIGPSPFWLKKALLACGVNPICNAVDAANYVMLKTGQPFHVFDYDKIEGHTLKIAPSAAAQKFHGLDDIERDIPAGTLMISDTKRPLAIAGILGGSHSSVTERTHNILIEAAIFDPAIIRKATKKMALRSESSQRFEKGIDPNGVVTALDEVAEQISELCGGKASIGTIDLKTSSFEPREIICRTARVNRLLGTHLSMTEIEQIFQRLGFAAKENDDNSLQVLVPQFRSDVNEEIDLVEEVARIYGYNRIEKTLPRSAASQIPNDPAYLFEKQVRERLVGFGLQEFLNSDLIGQKLAALALEWIRRGASLLTAIHAKTEEYSILRPSLLPGLLQSAKGNFSYKTNHFSAFEIGRIHFLQNNQVVEEPMAALLLAGKNGRQHWSEKTPDADFFDLKGLVENLFEGMRISAPSYKPANHPTFHPFAQADVFCGNQLVGSFGELHPILLEKCDIKQRLFYAEINLHLLLNLQQAATRMRPIPQFPSSERDWTISLPDKTHVEMVFSAIRSAPSILLAKVELIDLYIPQDGTTKNATLRFTYRDPIKTISLEEVEAAHAKLMDSVSKLLAK